MELLNDKELKIIAENLGIQASDVLKWRISSYSDKIAGYLGEHLKLIAEVQMNGAVSEIKLFVKCIPRHNHYTAEYLRETQFFKKEYVVINSLFRKFQEHQGTKKWRPKLFYAKEELFVFEDVTEDGYAMPDQYKFLSNDELIATVTTLARFHAQSFIYEEKKGRKLNRPYRIWEDYQEFLFEPEKGQSWRDTGMRAVIDTLKVFSKYKHEPNFPILIETAITKVYQSARDLMKPSLKQRNVVIHRDLWTNNIFLKRLENNNQMHAMLVDFQTVLYAPPLLDLSSVIYFNTSKKFRSSNTHLVVKHYYDVLNNELRIENIDLKTILDESDLFELYEESVIFGLTQAGLIIPIISMTEELLDKTFKNPKSAAKVNTISRSEEVIELAKENETYRNRILEIYDEIVERYVFPSSRSYL